MDIDVLGSYNTLKATLPHLIHSASLSSNKNTGTQPSTGGRIIFVSATLHYAGTPLQTHVMVAKAGIDALSSSCAVELGPRGITSNVIAPGPIGGTEGMERLSGDESRANGGSTVPIGRYGTVKEIADATVFLFGDSGNYVNGAVLVVDGGHWRGPLRVGVGKEPYPEYVLNNVLPDGAKSGRREKAKLSGNSEIMIEMIRCTRVILSRRTIYTHLADVAMS